MRCAIEVEDAGFRFRCEVTGVRLRSRLSARARRRSTPGRPRAASANEVKLSSYHRDLAGFRGLGREVTNHRFLSSPERRFWASAANLSGGEKSRLGHQSEGARVGWHGSDRSVAHQATGHRPRPGRGHVQQDALCHRRHRERGDTGGRLCQAPRPFRGEAQQDIGEPARGSHHARVQGSRARVPLKGPTPAVQAVQVRVRSGRRRQGQGV